MSTNKISWRTLEGVPIENVFDAVEEEFKKAFAENNELRVYIGADSQNIGKWKTSFVQCIAIHFISPAGTGFGGRVFFVKHMEKRYQTLSSRLLRETELSINLAQKLEPVCEAWGLELEVHADVHSDPAFKSHAVYNQVKGWIKGMGFKFVGKPNAFVASIVADRHTKGYRYHKDKRDRRNKHVECVEK